MVINNDFTEELDVDQNFYNGSSFASNQSEYFTVDQFNSVSTASSSLFILSLNIRSFRRNSESFFAMLNAMKFKPKMIILTETWATESNKSLCNIEGYSAFHTVRSGQRSGGVSIFVDDSFNVTDIAEFCVSTDVMECCAVRIHRGPSQLYIIGIYRSHHGTMEDFNSEIYSLLQSSCFQGKKYSFLEILTWIF